MSHFSTTPSFHHSFLPSLLPSPLPLWQERLGSEIHQQVKDWKNEHYKKQMVGNCKEAKQFEDDFKKVVCSMLCVFCSLLYVFCSLLCAACSLLCAACSLLCVVCFLRCLLSVFCSVHAQQQLNNNNNLTTTITTT